MARALARAGARVALSSRDAARADAAAASLAGGALGVGFDVRDAAAVGAGVEAVCRRLGGIDVLVNNAGIGMRTVNPRFMTDPQPFWRVAPPGFRDVLDTKVTGCFLVASAVIPLMIKAGGGRVVTISMNHSTMTRRGFIPYGPAGAAVEALARVIAADLADTPVRANLLAPGGATATGMIPEDATDDVRARLLPAEVMGPPIVWLASSAAADVHDERIVASEFDGWLAARA